MTALHVLYLIGFLIALTAGYGALSAAPWLPSKKREREHLLNNLPIKSGQTVFDLGCGDGRVLFDLAKKYPDASFVGIEIFFIPYLVAKLRSRQYKNVHIHLKDLFRTDISGADVVFAFLLEKAYGRLLKKYKKELHPEATIIFEGWPLKNAVPTQTLRAEKAVPFYVYKAKDLP